MQTQPAPTMTVVDDRLNLQIELEQLFHKNQLMPRIKKEFTDCAEFNFTEYLAVNNVPVEFGFDLLVQMVLHKRTTLPTLVGILRKHFEPAVDASQLAANMLRHAAEIDLVDWNPLTKQFVVKFDITREVQEELDRYQFPLPMVVPPNQVQDNRDTGYLTSPVNRGSIILKRNHHSEDVCLDHINRMNGIRFSIDEDTAFMVRNSWRNLDKPKDNETKADFQKRVRAFEKYDLTSKEVISQVLSQGNEFYLTHKYDKRGRVYCQGYHVNYQGTPWNKAVVELADREMCV
jgi:hypothetical protein